jgi:hypothetical protein
MPRKIKPTWRRAEDFFRPGEVVGKGVGKNLLDVPCGGPFSAQPGENAQAEARAAPPAWYDDAVQGGEIDVKRLLIPRPRNAAS